MIYIHIIKGIRKQVPRLSTFQDMTFQVPILGFRVFPLPRFRPSLFLGSVVEERGST
jgi:hypothetical protein